MRRRTLAARLLLLALPLAVVSAACRGEGRSGGAPDPAGEGASAAAAAGSAYACAASVAPRPEAVAEELERSYRHWLRDHVTRQGAGGHLRVVLDASDEESDRATYSEAVGYGMLLAAYLGDRGTFDGLWAYARSHRNPRGLMAWRITPDGEAPDRTAATDGDLDMAFALLVAEERWGGYRADAVALIDSLMRHAVEPGTFVLKPGDTWGGSAVTNPSYFAPAYYRAFRAHTGDARWSLVLERSYEVIGRINARLGDRGVGLLPDWSRADGAPATAEYPERGYDYTYDAIRAPWRLAMDAAWHCEPRARAQLQRMNRFFARVGVRRMLDGYRLDGARTGYLHRAAFVGPAAAAALVSDDEEYRRAAWEETVRLGPNGQYYDDALRLLSLLLAGGHMQPPAPPPG